MKRFEEYLGDDIYVWFEDGIIMMGIGHDDPRPIIINPDVYDRFVDYGQKIARALLIEHEGGTGEETIQ